jgi:hypothetical protein
MGVFDVLKFWKVRFAILVTIVGIGCSVVSIFLFPTQPRIAVILMSSEIIAIGVLAWTFWSIITNPPDIEKIRQLLSK